MAGILLLGATGFNGGKSQIQQWISSTGGDYPFLDVMLNGVGWVAGASGPNVDPSKLSSDGYPIDNAYLTSISGIASKTYIRPGNHKIDWVGNGTISITNATNIVGSQTGLNGSFTFTPTAAFISAGISAIGSPAITRLRCYHVDDEAALNAGQMLGTKFLQVCRDSRAGVIRFLDDQSGNFGNTTTWATRRPVTYAYYNGPEIRSSIYQAGCTYALNGSSNDYSINIGGSPTDKQILTVIFPTSATNATSTFSVDGGTIKKAMLRPFADGLISSARWPLINRAATLVFDTDLDAWLKFGGDGTGFSFYLDNGWPPEVMIRLAGELGMHPYFVAPYLAVDGKTDYMPSLASAVRNSSYGYMIPRFEGPNETWNGQFYSTNFGNVKQNIKNGGTSAGTAVPYTVTNISWTGTGASGSSILTISGSLPPVGARLNTSATWSGTTGFGTQSVYVTVSGGGTVTVDRAPSGGTSPQAVTATVSSNSGDHYDWYGQVVSDMGQAIGAIYGLGNLGVGYHIICGVQTSTGSVGSVPNSNARLSSRSYVLRGGTAAKDVTSHLAVVQYLTPAEYGTNQELVDGFNYYITNAGNSAAQTTIINSYVDTCLGTDGPAISNLTSLASYYSNWKTWAQGFGINKICGYEGGYSPSYVNTNSTSPISGATQANPCVITLATTSIQGISSNSNTSTPAAVVGMALSPASVGGMTQLNCAAFICTFTNGSANIAGANSLILNQAVVFTTATSGFLPANLALATPYYVVSTGNPFQISATRGGSAIVVNTSGTSGTVTANPGWFATVVSGTSVTLDVDASGFTAYTSGGTATYLGSAYYIENLRYRSKFAPNLTNIIYGGATSLYGTFAALTGGGFTAEFPSQYNLSGSTYRADLTSVVPGTGEVWGIFDPDVYATPSTAWAAIQAFNTS